MIDHQDHKHSGEHDDAHHGDDTAPGALVEKVYTDPVCGMRVSADPSKSVTHDGTSYYFCSSKCMAKFSADPRQYLHKHASSAPNPILTGEVSTTKDVIYTCPMHPEVRHIGGGNCPICGMALEPLLATVEEDTSELQDMTQRFRVSVVLSLPLLVITMSEFIPGLNLHHMLSADAFNWLQALLATPVVLRGWLAVLRPRVGVV